MSHLSRRSLLGAAAASLAATALAQKIAHDTGVQADFDGELPLRQWW